MKLAQSTLISILVFTLGIALLLVQAPQPIQGTTAPPTDGGRVSLAYSPLNPSIVAYTPHDPISIDGNSDFNAQAIAEEWSGDGTAVTPYVIEALEITGPPDTDLITIGNTDVHFQIRRSLIVGGGRGVVLANVTNGDFLGNSVTDNDVSGISLSNSRDNALINNTVVNTGAFGIFLENSRACILSGNTVASSSLEGIALHSSGKNFLTNNRVTNSSGSGIWVNNSGNCTLTKNTIIASGDGVSVDQSENSTLTSNMIALNGADGIDLHGSGNSILTNNTVSDNNDAGFNIWNSSNSILTGNTAQNNSWGFMLDVSNFNLLYWNSIRSNGVQATSNSTNTWHNGTHGNYWSDYTGIDSNDDGIGDTPYAIPGEGNNEDLYPLMLDPGPLVTTAPQSGPATSLLVLVAALALFGVATVVLLGVAALGLIGRIRSAKRKEQSDFGDEK
ncbi:MAG: nitrous oxide reductase family maturation protein NosD [Candidatus Heimdallarchaeota archaeon]